jgi:hypothetical protein
MRSKKPAAPRRAVAKAKTVSVNPGGTAAAWRRVWTLPIAMLMLVVAAGGLWLAARESSNAPQAAAHVATTADDAADGKDAASRKGEKRIGASTTETAKPAEAATVRAATIRPASVTGCLQRADGGFVLKNTEGTDAPRSRSWKSGFFRKSSASLDLLDPSNAAHLADHVGRRVSVTGPLTDREMRVQSLRPMSGSCQ